jgi:hypothetical protein
MRDAVESLWPELEWIRNAELREAVFETWIKAFDLSPLVPDDLNEIPFTLLVPNCPATFMEHKRCVVHIARRSAEAMQEFLGRALPIDLETDRARNECHLSPVDAHRRILRFDGDGGVERIQQRHRLGGLRDDIRRHLGPFDPQRDAFPDTTPQVPASTDVVRLGCVPIGIERSRHLR